MEKGNVLVIGNSGVGKSTLINAVLGQECAVTGYGTEGTTKRLTLHSSENVPFRIIDTIGFEPSHFKLRQAIGAVRKWSKKSAKESGEDTQINVIWFCVEGTSSKLFSETIKNLSKATSMWKSVPVIVVITKSYSIPERERNIQLVHNAFARQKRYSANLRGVIPVVADTYEINSDTLVPPDGISELIEMTNELLPEGIQASRKDIDSFILSRKRALAHGCASAATALGVAVGAAPIPFADAALLAPLEVGAVNALARIYGINKDDKAKTFLNSIVEVGTVSTAAKAAISALKAIPGINIGASVLNAVIAGSIILAIGEGSIYAFEQVYLGRKSLDDIDWVKQIIESKLSSQLGEKIKPIISKITDNTDNKQLVKLISDLSTKE